MTTYHVQLQGICDVIVEADSEYEAKDRAISKIPASSLVIEVAECKGVLEGEALETAYRYFPEHLAKAGFEKFYREDDSIPGTVYTSPSPDSEDAHGIYKELSARKASGETLDWIDEDFMEQYSYVNKIVKKGDDIQVNSLQDLINCQASMEYIEACYAGGDKLGPMQMQALYAVQLNKLKELAALID